MTAQLDQAHTYGDDFADVYDVLFPADSVTPDMAADILGVDPSSEAVRVLELGCGSGRYLVPLARAGVGCEGWDLSRTLLDRAAERSTAAGVDVRLRQRDIRESAPEEDKFDVVLCLGATMSMMPFAEQRSVLDAAAHMLDPAGRRSVVVETHHRDHVDHLHRGSPERLLRFPGLDGGELQAVSTWNSGTGDWTLRYLPSNTSPGRVERSYVAETAQFRSLAEDVGLHSRGVSGSFTGTPLTPMSPQAIWRFTINEGPTS